MPSKVLTSKMRVIDTPFSAKILQKNEQIIGSSSENGLLLTKITKDEEYIFDIDDIDDENFDLYSPIYFPRFNIVNHPTFIADK